MSGYLDDNIQVYELYNAKVQIAARTHPALLRTQQALLQLWHDPSNQYVDFSTTPVSYFDRLRIRTPGDASFTIGPILMVEALSAWRTLHSVESSVGS